MEEAVGSWVREVLGAREVRDIRSLTFGISSELRLIDVDGTPLVLRRYRTDHVLDELPRIIADEVHGLTVARAVLGDLVPEPVAFDVTGERAGRPSLLMTFLPGRPVIHHLDPHRLAAPLARLHASPIPADLSRFHHWFDPGRIAVPAWTARPEVWSALIDLVRSGEPPSPVAFLHRDFHPGNILWQEGGITGIVDWPFTCEGPIGADVAHTRGNLALVDGVAAAGAFLSAYCELRPDYVHHPWWDAADLLSGDEGFTGVMAFNAFGAALTLELLQARADAWALSLVRSL